VAPSWPPSQVATMALNSETDFDPFWAVEARKDHGSTLHLRRSYPASSVLRTSPPPHTARPVSRELPVDPYRDHRWGFPCCVWSPMRTCHRHYPGRSDGACSLVDLHHQRPSLCNSQVGSCNCFGACSAFTHVMACTLTESPSDPLHRKLRQLRCLRCRFDCYRVERTSSRAGVSPAEVQRLSRRTVTPTMKKARGLADVFKRTIAFGAMPSVCGWIDQVNGVC
jgi:AraC-like DNA-binding protein